MVNSREHSKYRFVPYELLDSLPNIIVDGAPTSGTVLTLSHWPKSGTPAELRRDTSTEIVYAYLDSPGHRVQAEAVSNNHFDEDGLIGIFALSDLSAAEKYRDLLIDVANAGDFGVYKKRDAARIAFTISAFANAETSPLPKEFFGLPRAQLDTHLYEHLIEMLPRLINNLNDYKSNWELEDAKLSASEDLIERGEITIEERPELDLALVNVPAGLPAVSVHRFTRVRLATCHPFAIHNKTKCSRLFIVQGKQIEFQYRYESWVQFASRKPLLRVDLKGLAGELSAGEESEGRWVFDGVDRINPRLHIDGSTGTALIPEFILKRLEQHLSTGAPAWNPYE
jgi:hypothetical protein